MKTTFNFLALTLLLLSLISASCSKDDDLFLDENNSRNKMVVQEEKKLNKAPNNVLNPINQYNKGKINNENTISETKLYALYLDRELHAIRKQIKKTTSFTIGISRFNATLKSLKAKEKALLKEQEKNNYFVIKLPRPLPPCPFVFSCTPKPNAIKNIIAPNHYKFVTMRFFNRKGKIILESGNTKSLFKMHPDFFIWNAKRAIQSIDTYHSVEVIKTDYFGKKINYKITNDNI